MHMTSQHRRLKWGVMILNIGVVLGFGIWSTWVWATPGPLTDQTITDAVADELHHDPAILSAYLDVRTQDGIVTLSGTVNNLLAKTRATRIAETVKGVRAVVNQLYVKPSPERSDEAIREDIETALNLNPSAEALEVEVQVQKGVATLAGTVQSWQEKQAAARVAGGIQGVVGIENHIEVTYPQSRPDGEIQADIEHQLRWDARVDHALVDVVVQNGEVRLTGTVGSAAEKRIAMLNAAVAGIKDVDVSGLQVEKWARDPALRQKKYIDKSDEDIRQAIVRALQVSPWVNATRITPVVTDGRAILRGVVTHLKAKRAAAQTARHTVGVDHVTNRIKVRTEQEMRNNALADDVRGALSRDPYISRYNLTVSVENGTAILHGGVTSYFEKAQAEEVAASVKGIAEVKNYLRVLDTATPLVYDPYVDDDRYIEDYPWYDYAPERTWTQDANIKQEIEEELWWSPFVNAVEVNVSISDGVATLTGTVESWTEWQAASENAYEGGAKRVVNELQVE